MNNHRTAHSRAFTLVELMISLGIALLLIYGINLIFRAVTDTVRTGNALAVAVRKLRTVDSALTIDFEGTYTDLHPILPTAPVNDAGKDDIESRWSGIVPVTGNITANDPLPPISQPRQPAITIYCKRQVAFLSKDDQDRNAGQPARVIAETGQNVDDTAGYPDGNVAQTNTRAHRLDTIGFFSGGTFAPRAMPGVSSGYATQAWIWYGHLLQHNTPGDPDIKTANDLRPNTATPTPGLFVQPGDMPTAALPNPRNYYATDWVLGRMAMGLLPRIGSTSVSAGRPMLGRPTGTYPPRFFSQTPPAPGTNVTNYPGGFTYYTGIGYGLTEMQANPNPPGSAFNNYKTPGKTTADESSIPVDIAVTNGVPFTSGLNDAIGVYMGEPAIDLPTGNTGPLTGVGGQRYNKLNFRGMLRSYSYWQQAHTGTPGMPAVTDWWWPSMVEGITLPDVTKPMRFNTVNSFSRQIDVKKGLLDNKARASLQSTYLAKGCTQFIVEFAGDFCRQNPVDGTVAAAGPDGILDFHITGSGANAVRQTRYYGLPRDTDGDGTADVLPVSLTEGYPAGPPPSFEKRVPTSNDPNEYIVAFGPNELYPHNQLPETSLKPWLIRITVNVTDPAGNLADGFTREFVFKVR